MLDFVIFAATVIIFLIVAVIYLYPGSKKPTTIPGPDPVDILEGNIPDIVACGSLHEFLRQVHDDYGPIVSFWIGPQLYVSIGTFKLFQEQAAVFDRGCELFTAIIPLIGEDSIQLTNGAEGRRRHALYSSYFTPTAIRSHFDVFNKLSKQLVNKWNSWHQDEFIPLTEQISGYTIHAILIALYGFTISDEQLVKQVHAAYDVCMTECDQRFKGDYPEAGSARDKRFAQNKDILHKIISDAIQSHECHSMGEGHKSVVDAALSLGIPESTMCSDLISFLIGGFHTSASLITWAIYQLALREDIQERVRQEVIDVIGKDGDITLEAVDQLVYLRQVLDETLRWAIVAPYACRRQDLETSVGGHTVPAGTTVVHALGVALHDPEVFPEPHKFDPERFSAENKQNLPPYAFEPFGFAGKRKCPGYQFSLAEASVLIAQLLRSGLHVVLAPDQVVSAKYTIVSLPSEEVWITVNKTET